ncbi:hypothetical protein ACQEVB_19710 [Pseudonocardia sp. CA-107938]|uniref:hypothetical protein n=1 Tax=Pseudonocardia sp. CA-107938 TaxID=3240021 RepID=UPI003D929844
MRIFGRVLPLLLAAVAAGTLSACSTPPGPAPATPAPTLPADAVAYDDLLSTDREFPFSNSCDQITPKAVSAIGGTTAHDLRGMGGTAGCSVEVGSPQLDAVWAEGKPPPNPSEPRFFPLMWNLRSGLEPYFRRLILDGRYYAVERIDFLGGNPGCYLTVDTGSPSAVQFRGVVPDQYGATYGELNPTQRGYTVDRAGIDKFMAENCPVVEKAAIAMLADFDPRGGSLAVG